MRAEIKLFMLHIDPHNTGTSQVIINSTEEAGIVQRAVYASAKSFQETFYQSTL
jgi:hypothetical protein